MLDFPYDRFWHVRDMPTGAENVRSWRQTGSDRQTLKTALMTKKATVVSAAHVEV